MLNHPSDKITYNPDQNEEAICTKGPGCPTNSAATFILGKTYFKHLENYPNAQFSIQAPLNDGEVNQTNVLAYVQTAYNTIGADKVDAIALGNEVNFYEDNASQYVEDAEAAQNDILDNVDLHNNTGFEVLDTANYLKAADLKFTIKQAFDTGLAKQRSLTCSMRPTTFLTTKRLAMNTNSCPKTLISLKIPTHSLLKYRKSERLCHECFRRGV